MRGIPMQTGHRGQHSSISESTRRTPLYTCADGSTFDLRLPFVTRRVFSFWPLLAIPAFALSGLFACLSAWLLLENFSRGRFMLVLASASLLLLFGGILLLGIGFIATHIADISNGRGLIEIREETFWDRRMTRTPVPWREIERAEIGTDRRGMGGALWLRNSHNKKRRTLFGVLWPLTAQSADQYIALDPRYFDKSEEFISLAVAMMVKRHGGKAIFNGHKL